MAEDLRLYQLAQKITDDVFGAGTYVGLNKFDPSQSETQRMNQAEFDAEKLREKQHQQKLTDEILGPGAYFEVNAFDPSKGEISKPETCPDCDKAKRHAYSDAATPGFFYTECEKHRKAMKAP